MSDCFDEIIGYEDVKDQLRMLVDMLKHPEEYAKCGVKINDGLLLSGEPGTGKTTLAQCFIKETGRKSYILRKKASDGAFLEKITDVFAEAEANAPSVILLDDIDKFTDEDRNNLDSEEFAAVQAGIDEVKGQDVFIMATANKSYKLPDSLTRHGRLGNEICVRKPVLSERVRIVRHYLDQAGVGNENCSTLETVVNNAGMRAAYNRRPKLTMEDMVEVCLDMIFNTPRTTIPLSENALKRNANHEAGHILAAELLDPGSVAIASIRHGDGSKQGLVRYCRKPDAEDTMSDLENYIRVSLAGKAANEVVYGDADPGVNGDMHNAFDLARKIVDNFCSFGFDTWIEDENNQFSAENRNREMASLLRRYYLEVKQLLTQHRELLDKLTNALIEKTTLTFSDVQMIIHPAQGLL